MDEETREALREWSSAAKRARRWPSVGTTK